MANGRRLEALACWAYKGGSEVMVEGRYAQLELLADGTAVVTMHGGLEIAIHPSGGKATRLSSYPSFSAMWALRTPPCITSSLTDGCSWPKSVFVAVINYDVNDQMSGSGWDTSR